MKILIATLNNNYIDKISEILKERFIDVDIELIENYENIDDYLDDSSIIFVDNILKIEGQKNESLQYFAKHHKIYLKKNSSNVFLISQDKTIFNGLGHFNSNVIKLHWGKSESNNCFKIKKEIEKLIASRNNDLKQHLISKKKIVFVHGFSGTESTWKNLTTIMATDENLKDLFEIDYYNYPTFSFSPLKIPKNFISGKYDGLFDNAKSLDSKLEHDDAHKFILVAHSLGGLIIREFLLSFSKNHKNKLEKVILFAPAHKGSRLASLLVIIFRKNKHLQILSKNSLHVDELNQRWLTSKLENQYYIKALIALRDKTINKPNAVAGLNLKNLEYYNDKGHLNIKNPKNKDTEIYRSFKKHLLN